MQVSEEVFEALVKALADRVLCAEDNLSFHVPQELELLLAMYFRQDIAIGEHCFWDGRLLGRTTWHDICNIWAEILYPNVTADRRAWPEPEIDLFDIVSSEKSLLYHNYQNDGRAGLTPLGRKVVEALIPRIFEKLKGWSPPEAPEKVILRSESIR